MSLHRASGNPVQRWRSVRGRGQAKRSNVTARASAGAIVPCLWWRRLIGSVPRRWCARRVTSSSWRRTQLKICSRPSTSSMMRCNPHTAGRRNGVAKASRWCRKAFSKNSRAPANVTARTARSLEKAKPRHTGTSQEDRLWFVVRRGCAKRFKIRRPTSL